MSYGSVYFLPYMKICKVNQYFTLSTWMVKSNDGRYKKWPVDGSAAQSPHTPPIEEDPSKRTRRVQSSATLPNSRTFAALPPPTPSALGSFVPLMKKNACLFWLIIQLKEACIYSYFIKDSNYPPFYFGSTRRPNHY